MSEQAPGVMGREYAEGRLSRLELSYRYRIRALTALQVAPKARSLRLLDLGAADGLTLRYMTSQAQPVEAIGIERSPELVEMATRNGVNVIQGDVCHLPGEIREDHYNLVTALALLEHLADPERCLAEVKRVLTPDGVLVVTSPNPFWDRVASRTGLLKGGHHHLSHITPESLAGMLKRAGLKLVAYHPFMFVTTAALPYFGLSPPLRVSLWIDHVLRNRFLYPLFVNQLFVVQKCAVAY